MTIQHKEGTVHSLFYVENENGGKVAEIVYSPKGENVIVIEHTEVDTALRGRRVGFELVKSVVAYAREKQLKVVPVCAFAKGVFDKTESFGDVLA